MADIRVYRNAFDYALQEGLDTLINTKKMDSIFNPDRKRKQLRGLDKDLLVVKDVVRALTERGELDGRLVGDVTLLYSLAGCKQQRWHWDYDPNRIDEDISPCGVLCALQDGTLFESHRDGQYVLNRGDILVFDASVVHAGAAYEEPNMRLHMYLDTPDYQMAKNETFFYTPT